MAAGDRPDLQADCGKRSNPAAKAFQRQNSVSVRKGLRRWREEIWDATAKREAPPILAGYGGLYSRRLAQRHRRAIGSFL